MVEFLVNILLSVFLLFTIVVCGIITVFIITAFYISFIKRGK